MQNVVNRSRGAQAGMVNEQIGNQALLSKSPFYAAGKGCSKDQGGDGCVRKGSGPKPYYILNNKEGGIWKEGGRFATRDAANEKLQAMHA